MKRGHVKKALAGVVLGLGAAAGASACYVELGWTASEGEVDATLVATYATGIPMTSQNYDLKLLAPSASKLELTLQDTRTDAMLAQIDLMNMLQEQQQLLAMLSEVSKQLHDTALSIIRKIGGAATSVDAGASVAGGGEYLLAISSSMTGFETIYLPLDCQGACEGDYSARWAFDKYVPEPATSPLVATAMALASLGAWARRRRTAI